MINKELADRLCKVAAELYSNNIQAIWRRSGGDPSTLFLAQPAREAWFEAIDRLNKGGGGAKITFETLVDTMLSDYSGNETLCNIKAELAGSKARKESVPEAVPFVLEDQPWHLKVFPQFETAQEPDIKISIDIVIVTVTDIELKYALGRLKPMEGFDHVAKVNSANETYYLGRIGAYSAVVTKTRMGSIGVASATLATEELLRIWQPKAAFMVGIAFGKDSSGQHLGQVLVADAIIPYEPKRVGGAGVERGTQLQSNNILVNRFEHAYDWRFQMPDGSMCRMKIGPVLSGEKLVDDIDFKKKLFDEFPKAIGGEMEGAGFYAAANRKGVACILIKSICDWADGHKNDLYQDLAAATSASLLHHVLSTADFGSLTTRQSELKA